MERVRTLGGIIEDVEKIFFYKIVVSVSDPDQDYSDPDSAKKFVPDRSGVDYEMEFFFLTHQNR